MRCEGKWPFELFSLLEGSRAILDSYLAMIASGEIDPCFPLDIYLIF